MQPLRVVDGTVTVPVTSEAARRAILTWAAGMSGCTATPESEDALTLSQASTPNALFIVCIGGALLAIVGVIAWVAGAAHRHWHLQAVNVAVLVSLLILVVALAILVAVCKSSYS